jgi:uncharacterized membrane protein YvbJ
MECPKCGHANSETAYFCITCHQILIHRCPQCWHEQRGGGRCEKCGTNFALYWQLALERAMEEEGRVSWEKFTSRVKTIVQFALWPIASLAGLLRVLVMRLVAPLFSGR